MGRKELRGASSSPSFPFSICIYDDDDDDDDDDDRGDRG